ncbi:MAG TPA: hypothetical protein VF756_09435 [Thermoanaerobaculia bacterium]
MTAIPPARVVWYVTGRFYESPDGSLQDLGYFLHLAGVSAELFTDETRIGEATARLTFRSEPFQAKPVTNGNIGIGLDTVGGFSLYYNPEGGASFDDPDSFSRGQCVATFRRASVVMGATISSPLPGGLALSMNVFSADLVASAPFGTGDRRYDLAELLPRGVTQWGAANANPLAAFHPYTRIVAFTGSAIAAG